MIEGLGELDKTLSEMGKVDMFDAIGEAISYVQAEAKGNCPVGPGGGELRENIHTDVEKRGDTIRGICFNNKPHAPYVEFGTGPKGAADHAGISPEIAVAYTMEPWWIHESDLSPETIAAYNWPKIETPQGTFYKCSGQAAHPFMYPALADHEDDVVDIIRDEFGRMIK